MHLAIDADSRVILDTEVTTGARHDNQPYLEQLQRVRNRHKIRIRETIADRGYGSAAIIRCLQQQGIEATIPLWHRSQTTKCGGIVPSLRLRHRRIGSLDVSGLLQYLVIQGRSLR